jgi:signal transduction histidine kinase
MGRESVTPVTADACAVLGRFAALLAEGRPLPEALHLLAGGLSARTLVVRSLAGELLGVGGEALQAVSGTVQAPGLELPVPGASGEPVATLSVKGGRPSQLPALRASAAILGLALSARAAVDQQILVQDHERAMDDLADALHDGPMQSLMVARYAADAAVRGGDPVAARTALQDAVVELRQLVWKIRPRGEAGLEAALRELADRSAKDGHPPLSLHLPAAPADVEPAAAALVYRVVQASAAREVSVSLQEEGVCVEIKGGLPSVPRWTRRAEALGCRLTASTDQCRLLLPRAAGSYSTDVRTTS